MPGHPASRPYRVEVPLRWSDMDAYGHVNNVQYLRLLEDARVVGFQEWFPDRPTLVDEGIVVSRHVIEYRAPLTYRPAPVEVDLSRLGDRLSSCRHNRSRLLKNHSWNASLAKFQSAGA